MDARIVQWVLKRSWASCLMAFSLGSCSLEPGGGLMGALVGCCVAWTATNLLRLSTRNHALGYLPVSRRSLAVSFWMVAVVVLPAAYVAGLGTAMLVLAIAGFPDHWSWILLVKRGIYALGFAASCSTTFVFNRWSTERIIYTHGNGPLIAAVPSLAGIVITVSFAWLAAISTAQTGVLDVLALAAALALVGISYRHAEPAWFPRPASQTIEAQVLSFNGRPDRSPFPSSRHAACLQLFWLPFAKLGVFIWTSMFVVYCVVNLYLDGTVFAPRASDRLGMFVGMGLLMAFFMLSSLLPNMRSMRMLPLTRKQLAFIILSLPPSIYVPGVVLVVLGVFLFDWSLLMTIALSLTLPSVHLLVITAMLNLSYRSVVLIACLLLSTVLTTLLLVPVRELGILLLCIALPVEAFGYTYYLIGNSSNLYRGKNCWEEIIAMRQQQ